MKPISCKYTQPFSFTNILSYLFLLNSIFLYIKPVPHSMKGWSYQKSVFILLAAFTLIARPFVIFSSTTMQASLAFETRMYGYLKSARKRRDNINVQEVIAESREQNWFIPSLDGLASLIKKWNRAILFYLSLFFCGFFHLNRRRSVFEVVIQDNYLYSLSVLRI